MFILNNKQYLNYNLPDDVAIGKLLDNHYKTVVKRHNLTNNVYTPGLLDSIIKEEIYHVRIKNKDRSIDVKYMTEFTRQCFI